VNVVGLAPTLPRALRRSEVISVPEARMAGRAPTTPPLTGEWHIDPESARVSFAGRAAPVAPTFRASFTRVTGRIRLAEEPERSHVHVDVDVASMTTGNRAYDELLAALDPFDVEQHPTAHFRSTAVRWQAGTALVQGLLTMHGRTEPVDLSVTHRLHDEVALVRASGQVNRLDYGVRCDLPGISRLVPKTMQLQIDVRLAPTD
jgi:polyisoprenoid-binding protein YceI